MATARAGRNAAVYIDMTTNGSGAATPVSMKNKWSIDQSAPRYDVTSFGDPNMISVAGVPGASGTVSGFWDADDTAITNLIGSSVARKTYVYMDRLNNPTKYFYTTAFFDVSFETGVDGAGQVNLSFEAASAAVWA
jgi:hypothetical protein